jgi:RimJ/RimL family protein N-acetyltransferase
MVEPVVLSGHGVTLEPLSLAHVDDLAAAASEDRSTYMFTWVPDGREGTRDYVEEALALQQANDALPFAVRIDDGARIVGSTRYLDLDFWDGLPSADAVPDTVEIGATWLAASVQGTRVNPAMKLLMLEHAFDTWKVLRVTFKTDARNQQSRHAILKLGAPFEGVRRAHKLASDGTIRDSAYFSIVRDEWPAVRAGLVDRVRG